MKKNQKITKNKPLVIIVTFTTVAAAILLLYPAKRIQAPTAIPSLQTYHATGVMNFTMNLPNQYIVEDKWTNLLLKKEKDEIVVGRAGAFYTDLKKQLSDPKVNILARMTETNFSTIDGHQAISGYLEGEKKYYIMVGDAYYYFSTSSPSLYSDLDQIAQSFRYTGK